MATEVYVLGTTATLLSTELNALANNALAVGAAYNNVQGGGGGGGYTLCEIELVVTFGTAPTANTGLSVWFLAAVDGTNYEDGTDGTTTPGRGADLVIGPVRAVTTGQRIARRLMLPWGTWKPLLKNDGTGQTFAATGNTLKIRPAAYQGV
jgi:hypothetical protein